VLEKALLRRIISACTGIASEAYREEGEVAELLDRAESEIFSIAEKRQLNPISRVSDLLEAGIQRIEDADAHRAAASPAWPPASTSSTKCSRDSRPPT
jgi:replicative DNA helicase